MTRTRARSAPARHLPKVRKTSKVEAKKAMRVAADVIVIGAGMAGVSTAHDLKQAGVKVKVVEATSHVGGRAHTVHDFGIPLDEGAQFVHAVGENPLTPLAKQLGMHLDEDHRRFRIYVGNRPGTAKEEAQFARTVDTFEKVTHQAWQKGKDVPYTQVLPDGLPFEHAVKEKLGGHEYSMDLDRVSALDSAAMHGGVDRMTHEGLGTLVERYAKGLSIETDAPVRKIEWGKQPAVVVMCDGRRLPTHKVVITASTAVLAAGGIEFDPPLPKWKKDALKHVPMGQMNKVMLQFKSDAAFKHLPKSVWLQNVDPKGDDVGFEVNPMGSNVVVGFVGGRLAKQLEKKGHQATIEYVKNRLRQMFGDFVDRELVKSAVTGWGENEFFRGAYTVAEPGHTKDRALIGKPLNDTLFFAGEAVGDRPETLAPSEVKESARKNRLNWAVMLPGAYLSGKHTAKAVVRALKKDRDAAERSA